MATLKRLFTNMIDHEKLPKLIERMQQLATYLNDRNDLVTHQQVNQFFYMQKTEELKMLLKQFEETKQILESLTSRIDEHYALCFVQWRKDVRWINSHQSCERKKSIL